MRLSQGHLNLLETCPRQFQHQVLEQLSLEQLSLQNLSLEEEERLRSGSEFHQIIQQRSLQLPIKALLAKDPQLERWFRAFERAIPNFFDQPHAEPQFTESEHVRTLAYLGHSLVVVYDYIVLEPDSALILDWKTYRKPDRSTAIAQCWQSKLYPYVLHQTSQYKANQIEMRYWFFSNDTAQKLSLPYTNEIQADTDRRLTSLLTQLNQWLADYTDHATPFPQTADLKTCDRCAYAVRCDRSSSEPGLPELIPAIDWEQIPEISEIV